MVDLRVYCSRLDSMRRADVIKFYGGNHAAAARALGITRAAVHKWGELVPELSARRLHEITHGKLRFDPAAYPLPERHNHVA